MRKLNNTVSSSRSCCLFALSALVFSTNLYAHGDQADAHVSHTPITPESGNWMLNENEERSVYMLEEENGQGVLVDVQTVEEKSVGGQTYISVEASGIPSYRTVVDQALLDYLNARPKATTDFVNSTPGLSIGDIVNYGQNIGFNSSTENCETTGGMGYWPPGPGCPLDTSKSAMFTTRPTVNVEECQTGLGPIGYFANGVSIYDWNDGQSYEGERIWQHTAANAEIHDLDICLGHAARGDYHHHNHSACLAEQLNDSGQEHSPVYGTSADGYPVHGPWHAQGTLAISSWVTRDYDSTDSPTGCGGNGERTCLLVDNYDISKGTEVASKPGPTTSESIISMSKNPIAAVSGLYFQDYYNDSVLSAQGGAYLDHHNGHEHSDLGYHYHLTITENADGIQTPAFPFTFGPTYRGVLDDSALTGCSTGGPPPGAGPQRGGPKRG